MSFITGNAIKISHINLLLHLENGRKPYVSYEMLPFELFVLEFRKKKALVGFLMDLLKFSSFHHGNYVNGHVSLFALVAGELRTKFKV